MCRIDAHVFNGACELPHVNAAITVDCRLSALRFPKLRTTTATADTYTRSAPDPACLMPVDLLLTQASNPLLFLAIDRQFSPVHKYPSIRAARLSSGLADNGREHRRRVCLRHLRPLINFDRSQLLEVHPPCCHDLPLIRRRTGYARGRTPSVFRSRARWFPLYRPPHPLSS